jgi:hypothetical protein
MSSEWERTRVCVAVNEHNFDGTGLRLGHGEFDSAAWLSLGSTARGIARSTYSATNP